MLVILVLVAMLVILGTSCSCLFFLHTAIKPPRSRKARGRKRASVADEHLKQNEHEAGACRHAASARSLGGSDPFIKPIGLRPVEQANKAL